MSNFSLNQLTEGIRERHIGSEGRRLVEKWSRTGLLRGLDGTKRENMSRLLENQAAQVLREANTLGAGGGAGTASGDLRGFTNIAFPIVRRVFGGLVANDLVSVQPMSLPSGLLFYLDYTYGSSVGGASSLNSDDSVGSTSTYTAGQSIYNSPTGKGIQSGSLAVGGQYDLAGTGFTKVHSGSEAKALDKAISGGSFNVSSTANTLTNASLIAASGSDARFLQFDPQILQRIEDGLASYQFVAIPLAASDDAASADLTMVKEFAVTGSSFGSSLAAVDSSVQAGTGIFNVRRLNQLGTLNSSAVFTPNPFVKLGDTDAVLLTVCRVDSAAVTANTSADISFTYPMTATLDNTSADGTSLVIPAFESNMAQDGTTSPVIPEIDIKVEAISVTADTRKLRARWSPELAQDLNAYHSMDAEVELTQILSEQIALEIDREILNDLITQARGANFFWSRSPGKFVNKRTGAVIEQGNTLQAGPAFTGTVREWYETLVETIVDVANEIHRKTLRGSANFVVTSPEVATIFEASVMYKPSLKIDGQGQVGAPFQLGAQSVGSLSNRFTVYKDPYFPRNKLLVGYKGGSYLETGYVYAPYVPLIVTPTIFQPEDFTPRKGVMTRYGKKMVRGDFYGTVTCMDMNVI
jgi:hypothetical protein